MEIKIEENGKQIKLEVPEECGINAPNFRTAKCCGTCDHRRDIVHGGKEINYMSKVVCSPNKCVTVLFGYCDEYEGMI